MNGRGFPNNELNGRRFPKAEKFGPDDPLHVEAQQLWIILSTSVMAQQYTTKKWDRDIRMFILTDEEFVDEFMHRRFNPKALRIVAEYCKANRFPVLPMLLIDSRKRKPSDLVIDVTRKGKDYKEEQSDAAEFDWTTIRTPTISDLQVVMQNSSFDYLEKDVGT